MPENTPTTPATPATPPANRPAPERTPPRRITGGITLRAPRWPIEGLGPVAQSLLDAALRLVRDEAVIEETFTDFAVRGQTRSLTYAPGVIEAFIQGHRYRPYTVQVHVPVIPPVAWERVVAAIVADVPLATCLLAGDAIERVDPVFEAAGVRLALLETDALTRTTDSADRSTFCKHALCAVMLAAEAIDANPLIMMTLRGMTREGLAERVRQRRALAASTTGAVSAHEPQRPPEAEHLAQDLALDLDSFWDVGPSVRTIETPLRSPDVSHPLLRRLGPSPFKNGVFPLVGLLATCYDVASAHVLREADAEAAGDAEAPSAAEPAPPSPPPPPSPKKRTIGKARRKR